MTSTMGAPILASAAHAIPALESHNSAPEESIIHRDTKGGRRLWYCLRVIQQPERARACGSGPKCEFVSGFGLVSRKLT